jgi:LmbE family N-acetylglucosaminyl deacetylase
MTAFTAKDIAKLGTILGIWAHPDDETFTMAGIMMAALANGQQTACVTATRGEKGSQDLTKWPLETLGQVREKEMEAALQIIGCAHHQWLDYIDGELTEVDSAEAVDRLGKIIRAVQPQTILTFGPDGMTGHTDHQTVSHWTSQAVQSAESSATIYHAVVAEEWYNSSGHELDKRFNIYFNIDKPPAVPEEQIDLLFKLPHDICRRKTNALRAQKSQTEAFFTQASAEDIHAMLCLEGFMISRSS